MIVRQKLRQGQGRGRTLRLSDNQTILGGEAWAPVLDWGRHYLMVEPEHFRVDYAINPFMDPADQPDPVLARAQWDAVGAAITDAGGTVDVDRPARGRTGHGLRDEPRPALGQRPRTARGALAHAHPERRMETETAARPGSRDRGSTLSHGRRDGVGAHFEAGDAFAWRGDLLVGFGPRTDALALKHLADDLDVRVHGVRAHAPRDVPPRPGVLPARRRAARSSAPTPFDADSADRLLDLVPEPLVLTEAEAMTFCANSVVVGRTVIMPACPPASARRLEAVGLRGGGGRGLEFLKGGGAMRCLTNPLDVTLGRDLLGGRAVARSGVSTG